MTILNAKECLSVIKLIDENIKDFEKVSPEYGRPTNSLYRHISNLEGKENQKEVDESIFQGVSKAVDNLLKEGEKFPTERLGDDGYELRKITGPTEEHQDGVHANYDKDRGVVVYRVGTMVISLKDTGDKLVFPEYGIEVPLKRGTAVFFPPYWTHRHSSKWSGRDTYRIQTWLTNAVENNSNKY